MQFKIEQTEDGKRFQQALDKLASKVSSKAGWFEDNRYDNQDQTPVATIALIQERGATIQTHHYERFKTFVGARKNLGANIARHNKKYAHIEGSFSQVITIPPRPFIGPAIRANQSKWLNMIEQGSKQLIRDEITLEKLFGDLANDGKDQIQLKIREVTSPPLSEITIRNRMQRLKNKKRTSSLEKPLIDTGIMFNTVNYRVNDE